ncbi:MAG: MBL fold metallo-hydrolase, partial [Pseudomonadales bacterium]|nr:MBL fold metallo-hydrolase [Pseudomonadales bacterium]
WSYYINEAIELYADKTDVLFASHHWPRWGTIAVTGFLSKQRDLYKYIHDQTLRMANHGLTATEIAEQLTLPPTLASEWYTRGYYGTLNHNAKAVYQRYLGWFDGNPANLHKLPPEDAGRKYVDALGGADALIQKAQLAYDAGDYRWVAELVNHLVFADPNNESARVLQANALEQLGYQAESGPWRGFYLSAAAELRNPIPESDIPRPGSMEALRGLPAQEILSALAVRLNGPKAGARTLSLNLHITDTHEKFLVTLENAVLNHQAGHTKKEVDASVHTTRLALADLGLKIRTLQTLLSTGEISLSGNESALTDLVNLLDEFDFWFQIVLP